ncbi:HAD family hydrolase [Rhizobiales bacterium]|uniref:HAD family hydrolase n=1 Tax=Hongsoonwoonella zoysiae TaxID=2821844 RepID=UPI001560E1AC|nr:HAD family hydrolase [Hongsoonwoonella zoysiae]NRG19674.1 HAD family hydrolase [Hongsoonwoonella zoysiae]
MSIRAVLFDKDGTLVDFHKTWAPTFHALIEEVTGKDWTQMLRLSEACEYDLENRTFLPGSRAIAGTNDDFIDAWVEILGLSDSQAFLREMDEALGRFSLDHVSPFDDLIHVLDRLAGQDIVLGIATNDAEVSARAQLQAMGIAERFPHLYGYDSGHGAKPDPGMVHAFCEAARVLPGEVVMVGDSLHDMHAGRAAGTRTLAVTTGPTGRDVLLPHADHVADSLTDGCFWIESLRT